MPYLMQTTRYSYGNEKKSSREWSCSGSLVVIIKVKTSI